MIPADTSLSPPFLRLSKNSRFYPTWNSQNFPLKVSLRKKKIFIACIAFFP